MTSVSPIGAAPRSWVTDVSDCVIGAVPAIFALLACEDSCPESAMDGIVVLSAVALLGAIDVGNSFCETTITIAARTSARRSRFSMNNEGLRHGIVTASTKRMAATEPAHGKDQPFRGSMSLESFNCICRAARKKSTGSREKRRQYNLVASYQENQNPAHLLY